MSIARDLVAVFQTEVALTHPTLEAVPADRYDWQPHEKSMTLGALAGHVAESPSWGLSMLEDELDFAEGMKDYVPFVPKSTAELIQTLEKNAYAFEEAVVGRDDAFMEAMWTAKMGGKQLMQLPRKDALRTFCIHHIVHHRAQLSVYLRLLDVPVPKTYGPTADQPDF